jgi:hypothetical protein
MGITYGSNSEGAVTGGHTVRNRPSCCTYTEKIGYVAVSVVTFIDSVTVSNMKYTGQCIGFLDLHLSDM